MSTDGHGSKCRRLIRVHERYRQQTDRQTDGRQHIANVTNMNMSLRSLIKGNQHTHSKYCCLQSCYSPVCSYIYAGIMLCSTAFKCEMTFLKPFLLFSIMLKANGKRCLWNKIYEMQLKRPHRINWNFSATTQYFIK